MTFKPNRAVLGRLPALPIYFHSGGEDLWQEVSLNHCLAGFYFDGIFGNPCPAKDYQYWSTKSEIMLYAATLNLTLAKLA